jgi:hypothetical protein
MASDFEEGMLIGLLIGEGHFGGDGRQPHVTLRMHERHEALFRWLERTHPGGRLYGPYEHSGRRYYQWMARGTYLRDELVPLLRRTLSPTVDRYAHARFVAMCDRYARRLGVHEKTPRDIVEAQTPGESPETHVPPPSRAARAFAALREGGNVPATAQDG